MTANPLGYVYRMYPGRLGGGTMNRLIHDQGAINAAFGRQARRLGIKDRGATLDIERLKARKRAGEQR